MPAPNLDVVIEALTSSLDSIKQYYDKTSGEVVTVSDEFGETELDGPAERYLLITPLTASQRFQIMEDFVESLPNEALQDELNEALVAEGAFLRFEEVLKKYPNRYQQWLRFRSDKLASRARDWLRSNGISV